ncbi:Uma2 family endonuclease [Candidatus Methanodesulfokora washburnensis]|jgi:Uma2 family endonuclease|uniref:Uma2 family endonuclease n=1 Tax=Candidatus Methanodesulfokora washburnensis TaxID=2478471 RepID=A0A3R9PKY1_9CREN|nr:Uma2 family endonuclease [Candidatus Methanodesulfokores washburnensis]RSN76244.1 Uma2 family endonuclease [Candidatus Methanodesulfokores washburnensis]
MRLEELKKESYVQCEVYRVFKNAIKYGVEYSKDSYKEVFSEVIPEVPIKIKERKEERADLVIFSKEYGSLKPKLIIETKRRVFNQPGKSLAAYSKKVKNYAEKLNVWYYVIYDSYYWFLFYRLDPYLIKVLTVKVEENLNEEFAKDILMAVAEISYTNERKYFKELDKYPATDKDFVGRKILPSLAKNFEPSKWKELLARWRETVL